MVNSLLAQTKWYPVLFDSALNAVRSVATWLTIALLVAFVVCAFTIKGGKRAKFLKISLLCAIIYAAAVGVVLLALTFAEDGIVTVLFVPILILVLAFAASGITLYFVRNKLTYILCGCITGAAFIATLICMGVAFSDTLGLTDQLGLYLGAVILIAVAVTLAVLSDRKNKFVFDSKSISYAAICIAMSFALSYLRIVKMPQGGSITIASLLPLMLYSFMFGPKKGVFAGFIYGTLQAIQDPWIIHPAQFILDYPAAFACIGLAGIFADFKPLEKLPQVQFLLGGIVAGAGRFIMHFISGTFAFGASAPEGQPAWLYSLSYQAAYVLPDIAIAIVVGVIVLCSPAVVRLVRKIKPHNAPSAAQQETAEADKT